QLVTGVQTCALPICLAGVRPPPAPRPGGAPGADRRDDELRALHDLDRRSRVGGLPAAAADATAAEAPLRRRPARAARDGVRPARSEERRVGEEGRAR